MENPENISQVDERSQAEKKIADPQQQHPENKEQSETKHGEQDQSEKVSKKEGFLSTITEPLSKLKEKVSKSGKKLEHKHYTIVDDEKDADAVGWIFENEKKFTKVPFKFEDLPDDQVRLDVIYSGLCQTDSEVGRNKWKNAIYPICTGHEIVGRVSRIGSQVKDLKVGDIVAFGPMRQICGSCQYCNGPSEQLCTGLPREVKEMYGEYWGGYATAVQAPTDYMTKIPENIPLESAPPLICAGLTCWTPIHKYARPGMKTAVLGIGGLGHMAVQILSKLGAHVTAFSTSSDMADEIKNLGANEFACSTDPEDLKKYEGKFEFVLSTLPKANENLFDSYLMMTANGGKFVIVGIPPAGEKFIFNPETAVLHGIHVIGSLCGSRKNKIDMFDFAAKHEIFPKVELFDFDDFPKALDTLENGKPGFRCVVNVKDWAIKHGWYKPVRR